MKKEYYYKLFLLEDTRWWEVARRHIIERVLQSMKLARNSDILELGCGVGGNFELLSKFGKVFAMDSEEVALEMATRNRMIEVEKGYLPHTIPFGSKKFDIILMLDVLEHIDDEISTLETIKSRLKDNGNILLTVPAYNFMWSRIDIDSKHKRRYIKYKLNELIRNTGFSIQYSTYFNTFLFPVIGMIRIINKLRGKNDSLDLKMPSSFTNLILTKIFSLERKVIPKLSLPFGVSILTIASKDN